MDLVDCAEEDGWDDEEGEGEGDGLVATGEGALDGALVDGDVQEVDEAEDVQDSRKLGGLESRGGPALRLLHGRLRHCPLPLFSPQLSCQLTIRFSQFPLSFPFITICLFRIISLT